MNTQQGDRLIPGSRLVNKRAYTRKCTNCPERILMLQVTGPWHGLRWYPFEPKPVDIYPHVFYRLHSCVPVAAATVRPPQQKPLL